MAAKINVVSNFWIYPELVVPEALLKFKWD